jgi:hypothetical protein
MSPDRTHAALHHGAGPTIAFSTGGVKALTGADLEHLKGLTRLECLGLGSGYSQVTDAGVEQVTKSLPNAFVGP